MAWRGVLTSPVPSARDNKINGTVPTFMGTTFTSIMLMIHPYNYWIRWYYDHLSAYSLLTKLGRWGWLRRLAWKKSQKTLDTSKEDPKHHEYKSQLCHYWDCVFRKCRCITRGCEMSRPGVAYNRILNCAPPPPPPDPRRRCSKFLNLNRWTAFCLPG